MAASTTLSFDISELTQLNNKVNNASSGIDSNLGKIKNSLSELSSNVTGAQINSYINDISEKIIAIDARMEVAFDQLTSFLDGQMKNYTTTYEGALAVFKDALAFIESNFGTSSYEHVPGMLDAGPYDPSKNMSSVGI